MYVENYEMMLKEIEELNKWKNIMKVNIVKMAIIPKIIYRFHTIPIKLSAGFLT